MRIHIPGYPVGGPINQSAIHDLIHSLLACLTASVAARAEAQSIEIRNMDVSVQGDMDLARFLGEHGDLDEWYRQIKITLDVCSDADEDQMDGLLRTSQHAVMSGIRSAINWQSNPS